MKLYIYFSTPKNFLWWPLSWVIRFIESSDRPRLWHSSHSALRIGDDVYEAVLFLGVRKIPVVDWIKKNNVCGRYCMPIPESSVDKVKCFVEGSIGVPYSAMELVGILWSRFMKRFFKKDVKNPFNILKRKVKCTEFVLETLKIYFDVQEYKDINNIGVADLENIIVTLNLRRYRSAVPK